MLYLTQINCFVFSLSHSSFHRMPPPRRSVAMPALCKVPDAMFWSRWSPLVAVTQALWLLESASMQPATRVATR